MGIPCNLPVSPTRAFWSIITKTPGSICPSRVVEAAIYPGSSGSPLLNEQGEMVGIYFATLRSRVPSKVKDLTVDVRELDLFLEGLAR